MARMARKEAAEENNSEGDDILAVARQVIDGLQATFGASCEVVLHDFRRGERSVVAISGDVTHRRMGSSMSEIGLSMLRAGDDAESQLNYVTRLPDGRIVKSSTMPLRTRSGKVIGAFCVNLDVTQMRLFAGVLGDLAGITDPREPAPVTFSNEIESVIDSMLDGIERSLGRPLAQLSSDEKLEVFRELDARGAFQLRNAVPLLALRFGVSRATVYNYKVRIVDESND